MIDKGQSITEYAVLVGIIAAGLIAMQIYMTRSLQGKIRDIADQISERKYDQRGFTANYTIFRASNVKETYRNRSSYTTEDTYIKRGGVQIFNEELVENFLHD